MAKPEDKPISSNETRAWRVAMLASSKKTNALLQQLVDHFCTAKFLSATVTSEPIASSSTNPPKLPPTKGVPPMPVTGTIEPNSRAVVNVVPLSVDNVPTALEGLLGVNFSEPSVYTIDNNDPLNIIVKVDPPPSIPDQPMTHLLIFDSADNDPTLDIEFNWQQGTVIIKAVQFSATITSEPLS